MTSTEPFIDPITAFGVANRRGFGGLLLIFGLIIGLAGGIACSKGYSLTQPTDSKEKDKENEQPTDAATKKETKSNSTEWFVGGSTAIAAGLVCLSFGLIQLSAFDKPTVAENRGEVRMVILLVGGTLGLLLMAFGAILFALRLDALNDWLNLGKAKAMLPVVSAVAVTLVGLLIAFLAILPARAEERNNPTFRRMVYGANAVLSSIILLAVLVGINAFLNVKLPVKLDTTSTNFYTLDPKTVEYVQNLDQPVIIYSTLGALVEKRPQLADMERLLANVELANPGKISVRNLSIVSDVNEINALAAKHPAFPLKNDVGILITRGNDENRAGFLSHSDLFTQTRDAMIFEGEGRLIRELLYLADNKIKPIIYVTQGSGELSLTPKRGDRGFQAVAEKLKQTNCDVRSLTIDPKQPRVPEDASLLIVADPLTTLPNPTIQAIGDFIIPVDPKGRKGKFLILAGANPAIDGKSLSQSGLEPILKSLGIELGRDQIFSDPDRDGFTFLPSISPAEGTNAAVAKDLANQTIRLFAPRTVTPLPGGNPELRVEPLFTTKPGLRTFLEEPDFRIAQRTWQEMQSNPVMQQTKQYNTDARPVAVMISEGKSTRGIVIGCGLGFSDQVLNQFRLVYPVDLLSGSVDTLRERPAVASLATKQYGMYKPPSVENFSKAFWLPVLITPLAIAAIGIGVWVVRRR